MGRLISFSILSILFFSGVDIWAQTESDSVRSTQNSPFSQSRFVPDISFIMDFAAIGRSLDNSKYSSSEIPGNVAAKPGEEDKTVRGFNFNYGELALSSVVDPYFDLFAVLHFSETGAEIEEAYFNTRLLPAGLKIRAGKFLSGFGRMNEQHEHNWDFYDRPLVLGSFFGDEGLNEKGLRLTCVLPLPVYVMIGGEIFQGENGSSFGSSGFTDATGTHSVRDAKYPGLYIGYIKSSFDAGNLTVLAGLSYAGGKTRINSSVDDSSVSGGSAIYATTGVAGADLTFRYSIDSYRYISLQSEYLYRYMDGRIYYNTGSDDSLLKKQSGLYSQAVIRFAQRWRFGIRYDLMQKNYSKAGDTTAVLPENLPRYTGMIDFTPTEFSRLRLQYSYDRSCYIDGGSGRKTDHEIALQFNMAIGAHGAHSF